MDLPPERGGDAFPSNGAVNRTVEALWDLTNDPDMSVTFIVGNHDIGVSGLRINSDFTLPWLGRLAIVYPKLDIETPKGMILTEHGHFYDPSLTLYAGDLLLSTYFGEVRELPAVTVSSGLARNLQRRDADTGEKIWEPGVLKSIPRPKRGCRDIGRSLVEKFMRSTPPEVKDTFRIDHWRDAAGSVLTGYNAGQGNKKAYAIFFGHTHVPDVHTFENGNRYFNTGDWCGDTPHSTYLIIHGDGHITAHDWISEQ